MFVKHVLMFDENSYGFKHFWDWRCRIKEIKTRLKNRRG